MIGILVLSARMRLGRLAAPLSLLLLLLAGLLGGRACGNGSRESTTSGGAAPSAPAPVVPPPVPAETSPAFSNPIAAVRVAHGNVVAGLVAAEGVVRVMRLADDGTATWTSDPLQGASWGPDAELRLFPAAESAAMLWRGPSGPRDASRAEDAATGATGRTLVLLGPDQGESQGEPMGVGTSSCGTRDGFVWLEPHAGAPTRVRARRWSEASIADVVGLASERDPSLVCGERAVFLLGDGEDDLTATSFVPGESAARSPVVAIRDSDFGDDDEREHDAYSIGDDLGLLWVGGSGTLMLREVPRGGSPTSWRRLKHAIGEDDDVVAVDGDSDSTFVVYTHDTEDACPDPGSTAASIRAIVANRAAGTDARFELAPPSCERSAGPFWIAPAPGGTLVAWVERATRLAADTAPITGVALRAIANGAVRASRLDLAADAVVDAGCDERACFVAALVRAPDSDGMVPASIRLIPYP